MGGSKRVFEEREAWNDRITLALQSAGAIEECDVHEGIYIDQMDSSAVEEACDELITENCGEESSVSEEEIKRDVESALTNFGDECYACANNRDSD